MKSDRFREIFLTQGSIGRNSRKKVENFSNISPEDGVFRPAGSQKDKKTRDYFVGLAREHGLNVEVDKFGNIFASLQKYKKESTIFVGSHLDSVINGGTLDGPLGVFGGLEAVLRLLESGYTNKSRITVVAFTGEEGSAFSPPILGSSLFSGFMSEEKADEIERNDGKTLSEVLDSIGYKGRKRYPHIPEFYVEMHIEQGPVLEKEKKQIGIVNKIAGQVVLSLTIAGEQGHSGTTPMNVRRDPLVTTSKLVIFINELAKDTSKKFNNHSVGTVGEINVSPNRFNVIPGEIKMKIDLRSEDTEALEYMKTALTKKINRTSEETGIKIDYNLVHYMEPSIMSQDVVRVLESSVNELGFSYKIMPSGAGHDAVHMSKIAKTAMIFVPSRKGVSHSPFEWTDFESLERGIELLTITIKRLDGIAFSE